MNDEIKEILEMLQKYGSTNDKVLLDYITNLQQENEELNKNQRYYKNGVFSLEYDKETLSDMVDDYKSRCKKAVEYIKEHQDMVEWIHIPGWELLNILQSGSEKDG